MDLWVAFSIGLFGSLHCVGMCGPIVMALPLSSKEKNHVILQSLLYHVGRITTYAFMGLFMGLMGWGILLAGYQKSLSIILGVLLIVSAFFSFSLERQLFAHRGFQKFYDRVKSRLGRALRIQNNFSAFNVGLLNGILPCGLVYVALATAVASGGPVSGALYMALFGLGTLPMMVGVMIFRNLYQRPLLRLRKLIPAGLVLFGALLIYRGVMLEVPEDISLFGLGNLPVMCH